MSAAPAVVGAQQPALRRVEDIAPRRAEVIDRVTDHEVHLVVAVRQVNREAVLAGAECACRDLEDRLLIRGVGIESRAATL